MSSLIATLVLAEVERGRGEGRKVICLGGERGGSGWRDHMLTGDAQTQSLVPWAATQWDALQHNTRKKKKKKRSYMR